MAEDIADHTARLQLDEETGEMVSKNELKKQAYAEAGQKGCHRCVARLHVDAGTKGDTRESGGNWRSLVNQDISSGDAKAIAVNFGFARHHGGKTILRFDDTNPDAEEEEYSVAIEQTIQWLGFTPFRNTYASDNFQHMYDLAEELIKKAKAYVCHCNEVETKRQRGGQDGSTPRYRCEHAEQDVETNLKKFRGMRDGEYAPETAWLRMKQDIRNPNPQMRDVAAYRIPKDQKPHFRTGSEWRIYPTYDFAHCLCDSFEGITHSLCTTEFVMSRESYEWLNQLLVEYQPMQREYGRLKLNGTVMSKRDLKELIESKTVRGWDDSRLYTLAAIRRRGIPPGVLLSLLYELGVTTATSSIDIKRLEQSVRQYLEMTVPRLMLVLDPIPLVIEGAEQDLDIPFSLKGPEMGSHTFRLTKKVYIDRSDFHEMDSRDYFRLAPDKIVGLLHMPYPVRATSFRKDDSTGAVKEVSAVFVKDGKRPRTYIQWVPEDSPRAEVRIHSALFRTDDPNSAPGGFMSDVNPESESIWPNAMIETGFYEVRQRAPWPEAQGEKTSEVRPESVRFQAMRVAYFALDSDSTDDKIVLNRIVPLKEDLGKTG